ncbi:excinuclease ABC subunit UvrA [Granulicella tundricola]|uniref:UvrABC system protein A n=1 Tax=Granulicella tundricola (strain ATCC BAA-1859 / DSM 23138 / MP5ACTX9) TaxID=1198114 RepID=E8X5G2_GRATM|nr:excinuclease ABC subunit UvrA [Granulicella tundricola]ADW69509.1 excinuclease ABC, A subunit [Granulicella tundricola MP5ACTX9]
MSLTPVSPEIAPKPARTFKGITHITVRGARQHNLKNVSVSIPRNTLTVVTGLSGSGKSSLAFDTIYAEGQRRYVETLSAYARQFLDQMERPDVDAIDGLSPAISIEQKTTSRSPRSTVGTITEIYDYLRLLYASVGQPHCPNCARPISRQSAEQIVERIAALNPGERITVMAPIVRGRKGEFREELEALDQQGFRARIDGEMTELTEGMRLEKRKNHTIEAIVDRIILKPLPATPPGAPGPDSGTWVSTDAPNVNATLAGVPPTPKYDTKRLEASVQKALSMANGLVLIGLQDPHTRQVEETLYSSSMACPDCGINVPRLEPRSFSFNSNYGACPECHGLGSIYDFDPAKTITDWSKPLLDGAMGPGSGSQYLLRLIKLAADKYKINLKQPFQALTEPHRNLLLYGPPVGESSRTGFHGIFAYLRSNLEETKSEGYREYMMQYMSATVCPRCKGRRLRPESLAVTVPMTLGTTPGAQQSKSDTNLGAPRPDSGTWDGVAPTSNGAHPVSIADFTALSLERALTAARTMHFSGRERIIADRLQREIIERLEFLNAVGLGYLSLERSAATLSGGEGQRIRLATQIGSRLRGVLYVLDEPSIGLHQRDNQRLIAALEALRDLGNTVLVVEHDEDTMRKADYLLDIGPAAGKNGGHIMASGTPQEVMDNPASITGQYLAGKIPIVTRPARIITAEDGTTTEDMSPRPLTGRWITVEDARSHNLRNVTAHFPIGVMTVVTGVSGSGKSSLVNDILYRALAKELYGSREEPGQHGKVIGIDQLDKVIQIDQSPIGRTPRSNPATYTGVFTAIRDLFAMLPESRERGYKPGRFSFNVQGGRCEACQGEGQRRIEMNFLPDVYVLCEVCNGRRYNQETLAVKFNGYSIADLLELSIADAVPILKDIPNVAIKLQTLVDVGLGYIHLGQSATTLSGGEAQRMKLARELSKRQTGRTLYLLDEPTTGLHFDDVRRLLDVLHRLTDLGNTVIIIEHNLDIIRNADYLLDLGPEGGEFGGTIVGHGTPEQLATVQASHTAHFLRQHLPANTKLNPNPNAGPQPESIRAEADRLKDPKKKFIAPEKKMGVPTASKTKPAEKKEKPAKKAAKKKATK